MYIFLAIILLYLLSILTIWQFVGFPFLMGLIALLKHDKKKDYSFNIPLSIIVPTYNEESVIEERILNLYDLDYPPNLYEIIIVDSGSNDNTKDIVKKISKKLSDKNPPIKLVVQPKRKGKASAINYGKKYCNNDIILVTDANAIFDKKVLKELVPFFEYDDVGGVGGRFSVSNPKNSLTSSTQFYWDLEYIMRMGESILDSVCLFHGEMHAWRKDLVHCDESIISEDLNIAIQLKKAGYKLKYVPEAVVYERAPDSSEEQIIQRTKTTVGTLQNIFKYWRYFMLPTDWYSFLIFPSHKILIILSPFLIISIFILYILIWNFSIITTNLIFNLCIFSILFVMLMSLKSKFVEKSKFNISSIPKIAYYVILNEFIVLKGWKDFIFNNYSVLWEKVSRDT